MSTETVIVIRGDGYDVRVYRNESDGNNIWVDMGDTRCMSVTSRDEMNRRIDSAIGAMHSIAI